MTMQHKYKAWDKINNVMREVKEISFYYKEVTVMMAQEKCRNSIDQNHHELPTCDHTDDIFDFMYIDLLQFTNFYAGGIKLPENEIYDGAILQVGTGEDAMIGIVLFDLDNGAWMVKYDKEGLDCEFLAEVYEDSKILGSIQENPELLEIDYAT